MIVVPRRAVLAMLGTVASLLLVPAVASAACKDPGDCPSCQDCVEGACVEIKPTCLQDADCEGGQTCLVVPGIPCDNECVTKCKVTADCKTCEGCNAQGLCEALPPACTSGQKCPQALSCLSGATPCESVCKAACKLDADCGQCGACQGGWCSGQPACTADADCGAGKACQDSGWNACFNTCAVKTCNGNADCGPCSTCAGGACNVEPGVCAVDGDCPQGQGCVVDPKLPCQAKCVALSCSKDADCGECGACQGGGCQSVPPVCTVDAECGPGKDCKLDPQQPCKATCEPTPCSKDLDCGACALCAAGKCEALPVNCASDADCGDFAVCKQGVLACENQCQPKPCKVDGDCGACAVCTAAGCEPAESACSKDADCAAGKICQVVPGNTCMNKCIVPPCKSNDDCGECGVCAEGACQSQKPECAKDTDCKAGQVCATDPAAPCTGKCIACSADADCGSCETCVGGACQKLVAECQGNADCGTGQVCVVGSQPCQNHCAPSPCAKDIDCPGCFACQAGGCQPKPVACKATADCGKGLVCQTVEGFACQNKCVAQACVTSADCAPCFGCSNGTCVETGPACLADAQCPSGTVCLVDAADACKNACAKPPCQADADCGPCGLCTAGKCGILPPKCVNDGGCPADQVCLVDNAAPCKNKCAYPPCASDANCGECDKCVDGGCVPQAPDCQADADCDAGLVCAADPKQLCNKVCQAPACAKAEDCGDCGVCVAGKCQAAKVPCTVDQDCGTGEVCQIADKPCLNVCVVVETDAGPTDAAADADGPDAEPADTGAADTAGADTAADGGAADAQGDVGVADSAADGAQPGDLGSDAGAEDVEEPEPYQPPKEATCTASPGANRGAAAGWLLALAALALGVARRRTARAG